MKNKLLIIDDEVKILRSLKFLLEMNLMSTLVTIL